MPALNVIVQVALLSKSKTALDADERLVLGVDELVSCQFGLDSEFLCAYVARVILLARMRSYVSQHLLPSTEPFSTIRAHVRELVGVKFAVDIEGCLGFEGLAARVADVWPFAGMSAPMILSRSLRRERFTAQIAHKVLQLRVHVFQVPGQSARIAELLAAYVTSERSLVLVDPHVAQIRILQSETLATLGT